MQHTQKLESLGVLAGGVAHDFNNLLVGILGNAELALLELSNEEMLEDTLTQIRTAARRAGELTRQLLAYSGKGKFVVEPTDLSALVREMNQLLEVSTSKKARVHLDTPEGLPRVAADAGQLRQVAMNLIINASDAIGDTPGDIYVRTGVTTLDSEDVKAFPAGVDLPPGDYVVLEVRDSGCGMDEETLSRVFEPFFTTKFTGRGLGLAAVQGIVLSHHGAIRVESEPGKGSTFTVVLPVQEPSGDESTSDDPEVAARGAVWRGMGRVLVVDDDDVVRAVVVRMLSNAGFQVIAVADGFMAIEAVEKAPDDFALAVVDLTMPGLDGAATLERIRELRPELPAVLISGFAEQEATERVRFDAITSFVQKPFAHGDLLRTVQRMIHAQHS
jgi:two-component system, cell cycle sensor histidine kinase and response regulator CckA